MKTTITYKSRLCLSLVALALWSISLEAQTPTKRTADTLRRELIVHTEEEIQLSERKPLPLNLSVSPLATHPIRTSPLSTTPPLGKKNRLSPLSTLSPIIGGFSPSPYKGYIHIAGGLETHGLLRAGYRPINSSEEQLDLYGSGLYSKFYPYKGYLDDVNSKEHKLNLGAMYQRSLDSGILSVGVNFEHHKYNYYGAEIYNGLYSLAHSLNAEQQHLLVADGQRNNSISARASFSSLDNNDNRLDYILSAKLGYIHSAQPQLASEQRATIAELYPELDGQAWWRLSYPHTIGARLRASTLIYSRSISERLRNLDPVSGNKTIFDLTSYWQAKDLSWGELDASISAGIGLTSHSSLDNSFPFVWPYLNALLSMEGIGSLRAELDGGAQANSLAQLALQMPYRTRGIIPAITRHRLRGRLSVIGELTQNLRVELYVAYNHREQDLNWGVQPKSILKSTSSTPPSSNTKPRAEDLALEFTPYYTDTQHTSLGGSVVYNYSNLWRAKLDLAVHKYKTRAEQSVSGQPNVVLNASYEYTPSKSLSLVAGYELNSGIGYLNLSTQQFVKLYTMHLFKGGVVYSISPRVSVQTSALWLPNAKATLYYGYPMRQTTVSLGLNVNI